MTRVTCRLTANNQDQLRNPTLGNRVWDTFYSMDIPVFFCCCVLDVYVAASCCTDRNSCHTVNTCNIIVFCVWFMWTQKTYSVYFAKIFTQNTQLSFSLHPADAVKLTQSTANSIASANTHCMFSGPTTRPTTTTSLL